jgi:hypothetical protein
MALKALETLFVVYLAGGAHYLFEQSRLRLEREESEGGKEGLPVLRGRLGCCMMRIWEFRRAL